jgi:hypothetical protein
MRGWEGSEADNAGLGARTVCICTQRGQMRRTQAHRRVAVDGVHDNVRLVPDRPLEPQASAHRAFHFVRVVGQLPGTRSTLRKLALMGSNSLACEAADQITTKRHDAMLPQCN